MTPWDLWKKSFDVWEDATARYVEKWTKSPVVLGPTGLALDVAMRAKSAWDDALAGLWGGLGLPTKRDQERTLFLIQRLESRLLDLEERLEDTLDDARDPSPHRPRD